MLHLSFEKFTKLLRLLWNDVEEKLVVNLKRHLRLQLAIADKLIDLQHHQLDKIGSSTLERSVDRGALREAAHVRIARLNIWNRANAPKVCPDRLIATHSLKRLLDERLETLVAVEVSLDILFRGLLTDVKLGGNPKRTISEANTESATLTP